MVFPLFFLTSTFISCQVRFFAKLPPSDLKISAKNEGEGPLMLLISFTILHIFKFDGLFLQIKSCFFFKSEWGVLTKLTTHFYE